MADIRDFEDAYLEARANVEEFTATFERQFFEPYSEQAAVLTWMRLPPEVREQLLRIDPIAAGKIQALAEQYQAGIIK